MNLTPKCRAVANYIIEQINKSNEGKELREQVIMSTKRLQKQLYFCDVAYMKRNNGTPLFTDDFQAWPSGPVIEEIYYKYMQYQDLQMTPRYDGLPVELTNEAKIIINEVLESTKEIDTSDLIKICRVTNGPWHKVYREDDKSHQQIISKEDIYHFYLNKDIFNTNNKEEKIEIKKLSKLEQAKQQLIKRYKYLYENACFILAPFMYEQTEEEFQKSREKI